MGPTMTSAISAPWRRSRGTGSQGSGPPRLDRSRPPRRHGRGSGGGRDAGFTLIELLVVIGIIVILMGLALPAILKALKSGQRTKAAADFQTIAAGLEAFKQDFGDYPRVEQSNEGFAVLTKALIGPYGDHPGATI